jgi:hypothetical protein
MRRRLVRIAVLLLVVGAGVAIAEFVPENSHIKNSAAGGEGPAQAVPTISHHVSPSTRRKIDHALDRFIPAGVARKSLPTAWKLAGPEMRTGSTLKEWERGSSPIPYYPASGKTFHGWTTIDAGPGYVDFNLLVHPQHGAKTSSWVFSGEMVRRGSRWLVNRLYTIAIIQPKKGSNRVIGPQDFGAAGQSSGAVPDKPALGHSWLLVAIGIVGAAFLLPVGFGVASLARSRRARTRYMQGRSDELPPLRRRDEQPPPGERPV